MHSKAKQREKIFVTKILSNKTGKTLSISNIIKYPGNSALLGHEDLQTIMPLLTVAGEC